MIRRLTKLIKKNSEEQRKIYLQSKELEWAHVFHDSIRGKEWLVKLPLNIGRWAGSYSFFYVLGRILNDYKPQSIIEFGLGESSKFISAYLDNELLNTKHVVIEQSEDWKNAFQKRFQLSKHSEIKICNLETKTHKGLEYYGYKNIDNVVTGKFDFYIVDGPLGSDNFSRFDIVSLCERLNTDDEFIIIIDDYNRKGEKETVDELYANFREKGIEVNTGMFEGNKNVLLIATEKYKYATSV